MKNKFLIPLFLASFLQVFSIQKIAAQTTQLWSMTQFGGTNSGGVILSYNPANGNELVQYSFNDPSNSKDGINPSASLLSFNGRLYGTTGSSEGGTGAIFSFNPANGKDSILHVFTGDSGTFPQGNLAILNNILYGMTSGGGANNAGVIFSYNPSTKAFTTLYDMDPNNAGDPRGGLTVFNGLLWGVALSSFVTAGHNGCIFSFDPSTRTFIDRYNFQQFSSVDGANPVGDLVLNNNIFYGVTESGGVNDNGTLFSFNPNTSAYVKLHDFLQDNSGFGFPVPGPTGDVVFLNGTLYGTCPIGGMNPDGGGKPGYGFIYSYNVSTQTFSELYDFDGTNGRSPQGGLFLFNSIFYGMTTTSGSSFFNGPGVLFSFNPTGNQFTNLVNFKGANGMQPLYSNFISFTTNNTQSISTGSTGSSFCSGAAVNVPYTKTGTFTNGNVFYAQLSDSGGHFSNAVNIGSLTSTASGTISATIPSGALTGNHYRVRVISSKPAVAGSDNGVNITIHKTPAPTITPSGSVTLCSGSTINLQAVNSENTAGYTFQWQNSGTNINGATSSAYTDDTSGSFNVIEMNGTCTGSAASPTVVSIDAFVPTVTPSGTVNICTGSSLVLKTTHTTGNTYQWKKNGSNISGATSFQFTATSAGNYTVTVNDGNCSPTSSATTITTSAPPAATITPSGNVGVCSGMSITFNANTGTGLTYQWKKAGSNIGGATASSFTTKNAGSYTVVVSRGQCSTTSAATVLTVNALPSPTVTPSGTTTVCPGTNVALTANNGSGLTYQWLKAGVPISGATSRIFNTTATGGYSVTETNANGCVATSAKTTVSNFTVSVQITNTGSLNICHTGSVTLNAEIVSGYTFKWFKNDVVIGGATGSTFVATTAGVYDYQATTPQGCTKLSLTKTVTGCALELAAGMPAASSVTVFPNPAGDRVNVEFNAGSSAFYSIIISDMNGRIVRSVTGTSAIGTNNSVIDLRTLAPGMYLVKVVNAEDNTCLLLNKN